MQILDFKSIVTTFADPGTELLFDHSRVVVSVNGDLIEAAIATREGDVYVDEGSGEQPASRWVLDRLARLHLLATRLLDMVVPADPFVSPSATLLPTLEKEPQDGLVIAEDALATALKTLNERSSLETTVLYVTSDAGEGKTSLINQMALAQARLYVDKRAHWLLVPIPLGGRHFLRFDDITVGVLQNRYRFPFLYYNSFLALVKMGVVVPAFDGFEEMFVESSSGEALSAMGILVGSLDSQGAMLVAARKAYFEFEHLRTQERLFDTIRTYSVGFGKLELQRWTRSQFIEYCTKRGVSDGAELYRRVSERLSPTHALLTRAVLVKRLVDVAKESRSLDAFLDQLQVSGADFFSVFVRGLIEREASEKWIDRSGKDEVGAPLLSVNEHCELLAQIALAMWEARMDSLKRDNLEFVAEYFCESSKKSAFQTQQVRERIRGHALLVPSSNTSNSVEFDHDEFRLHFLGEALACLVRPTNDRARAEMLGALRRAVLPRHAQHSLIRAIRRDANLQPLDAVRFLLEVSGMDVQASYTRENCSDIIIRLLSGVPGQGLGVEGLAFGADALRDRKLTQLEFRDCMFAPTSLDCTELEGCAFVGCGFSQLRIFDSTTTVNVSIDNCSIDNLVFEDKDWKSWDRVEIRERLAQIGIEFRGEPQPVAIAPAQMERDQELRDTEKFLRYFMRSTHISESVIQTKLGARSQEFIHHTLPQLLRRELLEEVEHRGAGYQRRFRLAISLQALTAAVSASRGSFDRFLSLCGKSE